jgi:hypothetical protein
MSRHYNGRHPERGRSRYAARLEARGLRKAPSLRPLEDLRRIQEARAARTGSPFPARAELEEEAA